jgi:hypothetical protein
MPPAASHHPRCDLCGRHVPRVTRHHLVPRSRSRKRKRRGQIERPDEPGGNGRHVLIKGEERPGEHTTIGLCPACHGMVHAVLTEKQLEAGYHSRERLLAHPEIGKFVKWVAKQSPDRRVAVRWTRDRHGR